MPFLLCTLLLAQENHQRNVKASLAMDEQEAALKIKSVTVTLRSIFFFSKLFGL